MALIIHAGNTNNNAMKALIVAEYTGVKVELVKEFQMGISNKTPEVLNMNPIGKDHVLKTPGGAIFESNAIARYVARLKSDNTLFGSSLIEYVEEAAISLLKIGLAALNTHLASNTYGPSWTLRNPE